MWVLLLMPHWMFLRLLIGIVLSRMNHPSFATKRLGIIKNHVLCLHLLHAVMHVVFHGCCFSCARVCACHICSIILVHAVSCMVFVLLFIMICFKSGTINVHDICIIAGNILLLDNFKSLFTLLWFGLVCSFHSW